MDISTICDVLRPITDLHDQVADTNAHYQQFLAEQILATGKPADQLTVGELLTLAEKANQQYEGV